MKPGLVLNIEPMINIGLPDTRLMADEWTVETADLSLSAQFEHTVLITEDEPEILTKI
jgi:methionyl aminopeptidase